MRSNFKVCHKLWHNKDEVTLTTQFESLNFSVIFKTKHSIKEIMKTLKTFSVNYREYLSQVIILLKILQVVITTYATSEKSISNLHRIKDWLRTSVTRKRLNHCMIWSVHKERKENLDRLVVPNEFHFGREEWLNTFGNLQWKELLVIKDVNWRSTTVSNKYLLIKTDIYSMKQKRWFCSDRNMLSVFSLLSY